MNRRLEKDNHDNRKLYKTLKDIFDPAEFGKVSKIKIDPK